ncbi:MAG: HAMP domain-containing histidine kinase [Clostridia bacterium]|nr:HAMP domain-containing histidine kinase [Clostridia bacterium]
MATQSTKFKYSNISKAICLLLATLLFSLGTWCAVELGVGSVVYGPQEYFQNDAAEGRQSYTESRAFETALADDVSILLDLASHDETAYAEGLARAQKATVEEVVDQYMDRQDYLNRQNLEPEEEIFARSPTVHFTSGGREYDLTVDFDYDHMGLTEGTIRKVLNRQYDLWEAERLEAYHEDYRGAVGWLGDNTSMNYYVRSTDGTVYTNQEEKPALSAIKKYDIYAGKDSKRSFMGGIDYMRDRAEANVLDDLPNGSAAYLWMNDPEALAADRIPFHPFSEDVDEYVASRQLYDVMKDRPAGWILAIMIVSYLAALAVLLWFLHLVGHKDSDPIAADGTPIPVKYAKDGSRLVTAAIDKLPGDVHFLLFAILFGVCLGLPLAAMLESSGSLAALPWLPLGGALTAAVCFLLLAEWLASVCRTVKSGRGFWKHTLIGRIIGWFGTNGKYIVKNWKEAMANAKYVPKQLPKRAVLWVIGYLLLNIFLINLMVHFPGPVGSGLLFLILLIAFNTYVLARLVRYLRGLDELIEASGSNADVRVDESGLPASLRTLAGNLTVTKETMDKAVEKAVQEERTRTELITNVTHDLKTPLTSLINYSDLLRRKAENAELGDEESVNYVGVIHDQSEKLKVLIDDLLEASKASAGNIQLNRTVLNLTELAAQAIAEFSDDMEKNGNEVVFVDGSGASAAKEHLVFADGTETYRILSNLLSNAQKYSAPNTRIYATVSDGTETTVFELKNTSAAPLNISAEELMERFVRGDRSRSETEGNGLGLSIARDLASLMGGKLQLDIDGDLFKATLSLPAAILPEPKDAPADDAPAEA